MTAFQVQPGGMHLSVPAAGRDIIAASSGWGERRDALPPSGRQLARNGNLGVFRLECDLTVTRNASEGKRQFPRLRFGLLSNAKVDAKRPIFRLVVAVYAQPEGRTDEVLWLRQIQFGRPGGPLQP